MGHPHKTLRLRVVRLWVTQRKPSQVCVFMYLRCPDGPHTTTIKMYFSLFIVLSQSASFIWVNHHHAWDDTIPPPIASHTIFSSSSPAKLLRHSICVLNCSVLFMQNLCSCLFSGVISYFIFPWIFPMYVPNHLNFYFKLWLLKFLVCKPTHSFRLFFRRKIFSWEGSVRYMYAYVDMYM